jgi:thymidylate synthase ThyX
MSLHQIKADLCSIWGSDRASAQAAWASSFEKEFAEAKTDADVRRVVTGVVKLHHDTPKERVWMEFFMTAPIFIERQYDKYRMTVQFQDFEVTYYLAPFARDGITQNELSGRYRTIPDRPYGMPKDVADILGAAAEYAIEGMGAVPTQDQGELEVQAWQARLEEQHQWYQARLTMLRDAQAAGRISNAEYKRAREVLRGVLGTAFLTDMRVVLNMNAFEHIVCQRLAQESQLEARVMAYHMIKAVQASGNVPVLIEEMIQANGWEPLMNDVKYHLSGECPT